MGSSRLTKSQVESQLRWVLRQLDNLIDIGPRWGTSDPKTQLSDEDITVRDLINPILRNAKSTIKLKFEKLKSNW